MAKHDFSMVLDLLQKETKQELYQYDKTQNAFVINTECTDEYRRQVRKTIKLLHVRHEKNPNTPYVEAFKLFEQL